MLSVAKIGNFEETKIAKIGKYHQLPKLANFEETKVAKIDNFEETKVAKIGKCCWLPKLTILKRLKLPKLASIISCQNWQMLSVAKISKFWRHLSCQNWSLNIPVHHSSNHQWYNLPVSAHSGSLHNVLQFLVYNKVHYYLLDIRMQSEASRRDTPTGVRTCEPSVNRTGLKHRTD